MSDEDNKRKDSIPTVKMSVLGSMEPYLEGDDLSEWIERFDTFLSANKVEAKDQTSWLLIYGGKVIFKLAKIVCDPLKAADVTYANIKPKLISITKGGKIVEVSRQAFYQRVQTPGESASDFALALKELSADCQFGDHLDVILRDRFIYNLSDSSVKTATMRAQKASFDEAVSEAMMQEQSKGTKDDDTKVNRFMLGRSQRVKNRLGNQPRGKGQKSSQRYSYQQQQQQQHKGKQWCSTCGKAPHGKDVCPAVRDNWQCRKCHKYGHARAVCRSTKQQSFGNKAVEVK